MDVNYIGFELEGFQLWVFFINYLVHLDIFGYCVIIYISITLKINLLKTMVHVKYKN